MTYPNLQLYFSDSWKNLCDLEITSLNQTEVNQKPGTIDLSYELAEDIGLSKGDRVSLRVQTSAEDTDGTLLFTGVVTDRQLSSEQAIQIQASNLIYDLEHIVFQTDTILGADKYSPSHLTLYRDENADPITIGQQIKMALDYAITQGALVTYDQAELDALDIYMPAAEAIDLTVAEVIKKSLSYRPDIITAVQYSGEPDAPQILRFSSGDRLSTSTISAAETLLPFNVKARYDLQVDGVVLYYYWMNKTQSGSEEYENSIDVAGRTSGLNILKQTIPIAGSDATRQISLPLFSVMSLSQSAETRWWWWRNTLSNIGFYTGAATLQNPGDYSALITGDSYEVAAGTRLIYSAYYNALSDEIKAEIGQALPVTYYFNEWYYLWTPTDKARYYNYSFTFYMITPNADNKYGLVAGDVIPEGLASQLFNIMNRLQYDGNILRFEDLRTPDGICSILRKLNIADTSDDLSTMNALIQQCSIDYLTRSQSIKFGPAEHLEPKDFVSLCRTNRGRNFSLIFPYS